MISAVRAFIRRHDLIRPGDRVLVAVSGGSDSTALAHLLHALARRGAWTDVGIVHVNHQLRASADRDERFTAALAESLGVPLFAEREDVAARARREKRSIEDAARAARYAAFERAGAAAGADIVAVGHTRDDQAETVLLRLIRGAGPRGLAGMYPRNGRIVRPLLDCRREALRAWLGARQLPFVDDESNADVGIPRNRVRAELLPLLSTRFNPSIADVLAGHAELARDIRAWMDREAAALAERAVRPQAGQPLARAVDLVVLAAAPVALQRAVLWRVMQETAGARPIAFHHIEAVRRLIDRRSAARVDAPGQTVERVGGSLVLTGRAAGAIGRPTRPAPNLFRYPLSIPGEVVLAGAGVVAAHAAADGAVLGNGPGGVPGNGSGAVTALVRADRCHGSLAVRNRRPGDRFRPLGLGRGKKLQDYFVDRKVPRSRRDAVPIVVDESDHIVWVAGHDIDEAFRVTDRSQGVVTLTFKAVGGPA